MKRILSLTVLVIFCANVYAQDITEAADLEKKKPEKAAVDEAIEDEIKTEEDFVTTYMWLMETPIHLSEDNRKKVNAAIAYYIEENTDINIDPDIKLLKFAEVTPELLPVFMGGYAMHMIENENADDIEANVAGAKSLIRYYKKNEEFLEKNKQIEKLIRKEDKDKLEKYIERKSR